MQRAPLAGVGNGVGLVACTVVEAPRGRRRVRGLEGVGRNGVAHTTGAKPPTVLLAAVDGVASPRVLGLRPIGDNTRIGPLSSLVLGLQSASGVPGSELGQGLGLGLGLWLRPGLWVGRRLGPSGVASTKTGAGRSCRGRAGGWGWQRCPLWPEAVVAADAPGIAVGTVDCWDACICPASLLVPGHFVFPFFFIFLFWIFVRAYDTHTFRFCVSFPSLVSSSLSVRPTFGEERLSHESRGPPFSCSKCSQGGAPQAVQAEVRSSPFSLWFFCAPFLMKFPESSWLLRRS